ncbi:hypothetical protein Esi_0310_0014 [Ectocarpus siliculosus]|uniref:Uncharacterized protein n=1 Tax=Ectocarpus siliculosus TaxID=2880 RepID=D7FWQ2_ECTSI|nr:hypothetical protein Esi_0310_0014 [Ectocarpus siliculosus]|eukprot:CBJ32140.1 hypothetical protein Esi_0310_0014 [Ectocarpus siliculosus]
MALLPSTPSTPPLSSQITTHTARAASNTVHPCLAKAAKRYQHIVLHRRILSAGCFSAASTPPPASGVGSSASAGSSAAAAAAGSAEQVPADRESQYLCPGTGCNTNLFLKENIHKGRADYPACRTLAPAPARAPAI